MKNNLINSDQISKIEERKEERKDTKLKVSTTINKQDTG
jgi:hypothetical protein